MGGVTSLGVCCCSLSSFPWLLDICQAAMLSLLHSPLARGWGEYLLSYIMLGKLWILIYYLDRICCLGIL